MKIILCGPPHSGKSVFLCNLIVRTPNDLRATIRACPDGEGTWSNNPNQKETSNVRIKGEFTRYFVESCCKEIDRQTNKIVFVDVGGKRTIVNEQIFKHCDAFIVISNNKDEAKEWLKFGRSLGLECIGCLESSLEGKEKVVEIEPYEKEKTYLKGRIVGLERGKILEDSIVLDKFALMIMQKCGCKRSFNGYRKPIITRDFITPLVLL